MLKVGDHVQIIMVLDGWGDPLTILPDSKCFRDIYELKKIEGFQKHVIQNTRTRMIHVVSKEEIKKVSFETIFNKIRRED